MKKFEFLLLSLLFFCGCTRSDELEKLDRILTDAPEYERVFHRQTDSLASLLEHAESDSVRFRIAWKISDRYKVYNIDTCLMYVRLMMDNAHSEKEHIIARSALVYALVCTGKDQEALEVFHSIPTDFPFDADTRIYYEGGVHLFWTMAELHPEIKDSCWKIRQQIRQELLQHDSTSYFGKTYLLHQKNTRKKYDEYESIARSILAADGVPLRYKAITEDNLGLLMRKTDREDEAIKHFTRAAILDLTTATKEYNSLYHLAKLLYKRGDNERACRYMIRTMNDAIFCNYKSHYKRSADAARVIHQAFIQESDSKNRRLWELIFVLILLLVATTLLLVVRHIYAGRERIASEKLRVTNEKLKVANVQLKDGNAIRDNVLSQYMEKSAYYIKKVDEVKSTMRRTWRKEGQDALLKMLRSPAYSDTEFKNYFQEFDEGILRMFPHFVEDVNHLTAPEHAFSLDKNGSFSTELRVLALIRLGITDSSQIANALNISIGTTYVYRYRMRHNAVCPPDEFENRIREIGLYD